MYQLTDEQRATLFALLDVQESVLESALHEHAARLRDSNAPEVTPSSGDIADQAERELIREYQNGAVVRDVRALRDIAAARSRLAADSAGACIDCAGAIGFERLLAQPTATRCADCQRIYEQPGQSAFSPGSGAPIDAPRHGTTAGELNFLTRLGDAR